MAFTVTVQGRDVWGVHEVVYGKYVNDGGSTGGDISHGLHVVHGVILQPWKSAVTSQHAVNGTLPLSSGSAVTIVTGANESGGFVIFGN